MRWTSGFQEIMETWADASDMRYIFCFVLRFYGRVNTIKVMSACQLTYPHCSWAGFLLPL